MFVMHFLSILLIAAVISPAWTAVDSNEIYSVDLNNSDGDKTLSLTVNPQTKKVELAEFRNSNGNQRFIARINSEGHTFTLFSEVQPWNWLDHIVESTKYIHIKQVPQALGVVGGSMEVVEENYQGADSGRQKWYIVPTGEDENTGVITNLLQRQCLQSQGANHSLTIVPCDFSHANQIFTLTSRTSGRCY